MWIPSTMSTLCPPDIICVIIVLRKNLSHFSHCYAFVCYPDINRRSWEELEVTPLSYYSKYVLVSYLWFSLLLLVGLGWGSVLKHET